MALQSIVEVGSSISSGHRVRVLFSLFSTTSIRERARTRTVPRRAIVRNRNRSRYRHVLVLSCAGHRAQRVLHRRHSARGRDALASRLVSARHGSSRIALRHLRDPNPAERSLCQHISYCSSTCNARVRRTRCPHIQRILVSSRDCVRTR